MPKSDAHVSGVIRLSGTLDRQVREIAQQTRQPISQVLNTLVLYALDHMVLKQVTLYKMTFKE